MICEDQTANKIWKYLEWRNQVTCWNCDGTAGGKPDNGWIWDTGADVHICKDELIMTDLQHINGCIQQAQGHSSMTLEVPYTLWFGQKLH
ncbi:hypothetical protein NDA17_003425 [Ustilago hordei]|nr:hypothetical protein NDA17_003425 [Ustilago hordei]